MSTQQPIWKCVGHIGDVDPIAHGGGFVYVDETGVYPPEMTWFEPAPDEDWHKTEGATPLKAYRVSLERYELFIDDGIHYLVPFGFANKARQGELTYPIVTYDAWFNGAAHRPQDNHLGRVASSFGIPVTDLREQFTSDDPVTLAAAYEILIRHHGVDNFDSYPTELTEDEAYAKYADEMTQARAA